MRLTHIYKPGFGQEEKEPDTHAQESYVFQQHPENHPRSGDLRVVVKFEGFGRSEKRSSDYQVEVNWLDMKWLLEQFVEAGDEHAEYLIMILRMAHKLGDAGWHNDQEPPDFWEGLIED